jgi:hypothetical protein
MLHSKRTTSRGLSSLLLIIATIAGVVPGPGLAHAQQAVRFFPETSESVGGRFLQYWDTHGGLAQQGFPISSEIGERSPVDGKTYTVQYFERAVFEYHPENRPPFDVLLSLLGTFRYHNTKGDSFYQTRRIGSEVPNNSPGSVLFAATSKRVGGDFLAYWKTHGGLAQQGYPISDEFTEEQRGPDSVGGTFHQHQYRVQYFERAVFEYHPENPASSRVLLSRLGMFRYNDTYITREGGSTCTFYAPPYPVSPTLAHVTGGPKDMHKYADYLASQYGTMGDITLNVSQAAGYGWDSGSTPRVILAVACDTLNELNVAIQRQGIETTRRWEAAWGLAIQADLTATWPGPGQEVLFVLNVDNQCGGGPIMTIGRGVISVWH